jgi:hypothetical protein
LIKFLIGAEGSGLLEKFMFKIIPMVNPDGVSVGNSRCNVSGCDLNRNWLNPSESKCPEIVCVKARLTKTLEKREIFIFCDLHGHSKKYGCFMFGCSKKQNCLENWIDSHMLPNIFSQKSAFFSYKDCRFGVSEDRRATARVTVWQDFEVSNSFTLETSFYGYKDESGKPQHFTVENLESIGFDLLISI